MFLSDDSPRELQFLPCTNEDLDIILKTSLDLLTEFQKDQPLNLSLVRQLIIERTKEELPDYTKLMEGVELIGWYHIIEGPESLELDDVNILESFRSRGYGTRLLDRVLEEGRIKQKLIMVTVSSDNTGAVRFYERQGFRFTHRNQQHHLCFINDSHLKNVNKP